MSLVHRKRNQIYFIRIQLHGHTKKKKSVWHRDSIVSEPNENNQN